MTIDRLTSLAQTIEMLRRQLRRARQVRPGAGYSERKAANAVALDLEGRIADAIKEYDEELAKVNAVTP